GPSGDPVAADSQALPGLRLLEAGQFGMNCTGTRLQQVECVTNFLQFGALGRIYRRPRRRLLCWGRLLGRSLLLGGPLRWRCRDLLLDLLWRRGKLLRDLLRLPLRRTLPLRRLMNGLLLLLRLLLCRGLLRGNLRRLLLRLRLLAGDLPNTSARGGR